MTITDRIEINPKVMMGKPVIRGTRIPVELILRKLSEGATEDNLLDAYPRLKAEVYKPPLVMLPTLWLTRKRLSSNQKARETLINALSGRRKL